MKDYDNIFYERNEFLDEKWSIAQSFIMKIANGDFNLTLPKNIGYDHIDAILLSLKLASELLKDRDEFYLTIGAFQGINKGMAILGTNYSIVQMNAEFEQITKSKFIIGENIFSREPFSSHKNQFLWEHDEIAFQKKFSIEYENDVLEICLSNFSKTFATKNKGFLLSIEMK